MLPLATTPPRAVTAAARAVDGTHARKRAIVAISIMPVLARRSTSAGIVYSERRRRMKTIGDKYGEVDGGSKPAPYVWERGAWRVGGGGSTATQKRERKRKEKRKKKKREGGGEEPKKKGRDQLEEK